MLWLIPAICGAVAIGCIAYGTFPLLRAKDTVQAHAERLQAALPVALIDGAHLRMTLGRLDDSAAGFRAQLLRISAAAGRIGDGLRALRLREAMLAMRLAGAAVRALRELF